MFLVCNIFKKSWKC